MFVGSLRLVIHIPAAQSLKDRRRVVNRLKDRIRARLSVSLCEVGDAERHQVATLGVVTVARDASSCRRVLESVKAMAETLGDAWLTEANGEIFAFGCGGQNLRGGIESFDSSGIYDEEGLPKDPKKLGSLEDLLDGLTRSEDSGNSPGSVDGRHDPNRPMHRIRKK